MNEKKQFVIKSKGITLIALVITIIVMLILAGVSLSATIGDNGILTKAKEAKATQDLARLKEDLEYMFLQYNVWESDEKTISEFLKGKIESGDIEDFRAYPVDDEFKMVIKKEGKYFFVEQDDGAYKAVQMGGVSDENSDFTIVTREEFKQVTDGTMKFELAENQQTTIIFYDEIEDSLNFDIVSGNVTIYMTQDMTLTNKGLKRSAVDVHSGATLNLYVLEGVKMTVDSGFGEDANGNVPGKGGYAGIHVPEGATLNLHGKGTIDAFGGNAGNGFIGDGYQAGGGGAGAGIGGNGGNGGSPALGEEIDSRRIAENGGQGENAGNINIYNNIMIYAYGGAGASGGTSTDGSGGGAGGYPAAGIGGGGAGGAGATCCTGAGGFSGGSGGSYDTDIFSINGLFGHTSDRCSNNYWGAGGYFSGPEGNDVDGNDAKNLLGGMGGLSWWVGHRGGDGGTAGQGANVKVSETANIYAFNGNRYTDGTSYMNGINQTPIYLQAGCMPKRQEVTSIDIHAYDNLYNKIWHMRTTSEQKTGLPKTGYINSKYMTDSEFLSNKTLTMNYLLSNVDMSTQGIGSGAGYIEVSNGTYTIDSSLN